MRCESNGLVLVVSITCQIIHRGREETSVEKMRRKKFTFLTYLMNGNFSFLFFLQDLFPYYAAVLGVSALFRPEENVKSNFTTRDLDFLIWKRLIFEFKVLK